MAIKFTNNAYSTLASGITNSATSITLTTGEGARFPSFSAPDYFLATLIDSSNNLEIVKCTTRSTDVLTVVRAQESTTARAYTTGDRIELRITAGVLDALYDDTTVGGATGVDFNDDVKARFGTGNDLEIYHDASHSYITDGGTGNLKIGGSQVDILGTSETMATFVDDGAVTLYHNNVAKVATTANGLTVTGTAIATTDTDASNTGTVDLDFAAKQNFVLTLTGNITSLTASNEQVGQSGFIAFIQDGTGGRTVSLHGDYETAATAGLTLTTTAAAVDLVPYVVIAASRILLGTPQLAFG